MKEDSNKLKEYLRENPKGVFKAVHYDSSRSVDIEIPEGAELMFINDCDQEFLPVFAKESFGIIFVSWNNEWSATSWESMETLIDNPSNEVLWKRDDVSKDKSVVSHPKHYVSDPCVVNGKTISDGGSSSYYFTKLPKHVIDEINRTGGVEIKDIARYVYDNNADAFNIIKAQKRIIEDLKGLGKVGADAKYDAKKILFFAEEQYKQIIEGVKIND